MEKFVFLLLGFLLIGVWVMCRMVFHVQNGFINAPLLIGVLALMVHFAIGRRMA